MPQCGPYRIIELSYQTRMARLEVRGGKDKWVHLRWLSLCDLSALNMYQKKPWTGNYKCHEELEPILETNESQATEDQSHVQGEEERRVKSKRVEGDPDSDFSKFADSSSGKSIAIDGEEDSQSAEIEEDAPEVQTESEKSTESFQEQRGRRPKKKQTVRSEGGEISSRTQSHSPLLSSLHVNTERHYSLSSLVLTHPMFAISSVAEPGLLELFADRLCSGEATIICFSTLTAKAMSE